MVTPSAHRVHHGVNVKYLNKNFGNLFIIWDRIFGTYAEEKEEVILLNIEDLIFNFDPEDNVQKEELFKLKLKFFDRDEVKSSKKRKAKTDLRKAETPLEAIVLYNSFVK